MNFLTEIGRIECRFNQAQSRLNKAEREYRLALKKAENLRAQFEELQWTTSVHGKLFLAAADSLMRAGVSREALRKILETHE